MYKIAKVVQLAKTPVKSLWHNDSIVSLEEGNMNKDFLL